MRISDWSSDVCSSDLLVAAVVAAGYDARLADQGRSVDAERERRGRELSRLRWSLGAAAALTLPIDVLEMGSHLIEPLGNWLTATLGLQAVLFLSFILARLCTFAIGIHLCL